MKYPIGIQNFEKLRTEGFAYVDKTQFIYQLADRGCYYFLSRPRRFGKSLLLSTIQAYFEGKRELFSRLAMEQLEKDWTVYPVLHLDLNTAAFKDNTALKSRLSRTLDEWEEQYGLPISTDEPHYRFEKIIKHAHKQTGKQVVILVDEYDKPMLQSIGNAELQDDYRSTLKSFYSVMKSQDEHIRFAFLTGVTKFGKVSVFSDLNNLEDISMLPQFNGICGITETELHAYFEQGIEQLAQTRGETIEATTELLRRQFDGYHFVPHSEGVYNPFSLLNTLKNRVIRDYWFETGTPTFLVELLKHSDYDLRQLQEEDVQDDVINSVDSMSQNPIPVIYQSGYLTIKDYDPEFGTYRLGFPNREVEVGFTKFLLPFYTPKSENKAYSFVGNFVKDVRSGKPEQFLERLQTFFDDSDYRVAGKMELYFQNAMYLIFRMMGFFTEVERATSRGRVDVVIKTADYIYIIEIKLDGTAEDALRQIDEKGYARPFATDTRKIFKLGVNFSSETRSISEWKIAES